MKLPNLVVTKATGRLHVKRSGIKTSTKLLGHSLKLILFHSFQLIYLYERVSNKNVRKNELSTKLQDPLILNYVDLFRADLIQKIYQM